MSRVGQFGDGFVETWGNPTGIGFCIDIEKFLDRIVFIRISTGTWEFCGSITQGWDLEDGFVVQLFHK
jgi:hypothetical protein